MKSAAIASLFFALVAQAAPAQNGEILMQQSGNVPPAGSVRIRKVSYGGNGCPQNTVTSSISQDGTTVNLLFNEYSATLIDDPTNPTAALRNRRKNCQVVLDITYPSGYQYSIFSVDTRGYAAIDPGVIGTISTTYYFSGSSSQAFSKTDLVGPTNGNYLKHDDVDNRSQVYSPCGAEGMVNINSAITLERRSGSGTGLLTTESVDAKFKQQYALGWRACSSSNNRNRIKMIDTSNANLEVANSTITLY